MCAKTCPLPVCACVECLCPCPCLCNVFRAMSLSCCSDPLMRVPEADENDEDGMPDSPARPPPRATSDAPEGGTVELVSSQVPAEAGSDGGDGVGQGVGGAGVGDAHGAERGGRGGGFGSATEQLFLTLCAIEDADLTHCGAFREVQRVYARVRQVVTWACVRMRRRLCERACAGGVRAWV